MDAAPTLDLAQVRRVGRFEGNRFAWSGSALEIRFRGRSLAIDLVVPSPPSHPTHDVRGKPMTLAEPTVPYAVFLDGKRGPDLQVGPHRRRYLVAHGLDAEHDHVVRVVRESEAKAGVHELVGVALPEGGELLAPRARRTQIEVIGDSIACGYGILGANEKCGFSYATERATLAWPYKVSEERDADLTLVCWSGRGVRRNYDGSTTETMTELYLRLPPLSPPPEAVLVALGTNDFLSPSATGGDLEPLRARYRDLLRAVRARYPTARIAGIESPMLPEEPLKNLGPWRVRAFARAMMDEVVTDLVREGDVDMHFVYTRHQGKQLGCDYHPNAAMQDAVAVRTHGWLVGAGVLRSD